MLQCEHQRSLITSSTCRAFRATGATAQSHAPLPLGSGDDPGDAEIFNSCPDRCYRVPVK